MRRRWRAACGVPGQGREDVIVVPNPNRADNHDQGWRRQPRGDTALAAAASGRSVPCAVRENAACRRDEGFLVAMLLLRRVCAPAGLPGPGAVPPRSSPRRWPGAADAALEVLGDLQVLLWPRNSANWWLLLQLRDKIGQSDQPEKKPRGGVVHETTTTTRAPMRRVPRAADEAVPAHRAHHRASQRPRSRPEKRSSIRPASRPPMPLPDCAEEGERNKGQHEDERGAPAR